MMKKLIKLIVKFFSDLRERFSHVDLSVADEAISVADFVRSILKSDITAALVTATATQWDNKAKDSIVSLLDRILPYLHTVSDVNHLPAEERVAYILNKIKERPSDGQHKDLLGIASRYLRMQHPDLAESEADGIIQGMVLQGKFNN